jgi:LysM repeat protein
MAAVIDLHTGSQVAAAPSDGAGVARPDLRLIQGGRARPGPVGGPTDRRVFLVRRVAVGVVAALVVLLLAQVVGAVLSAAGAVLSPRPAASDQVHTVRPGESLWSIAGDLAPGVDRRVAVDDLAALNGDADVRAGQHLRLPASFD